MKTKVCTKCKKRKRIDEFGFKKDSKDKLTSQCKKCRNEAIRKYQRKPEIKAKRREYEKKNQERIRKRYLKWKKRYFKENPEKIKEYQEKSRINAIKYYHKNKENIRKKRREYYKKNIEKIRKRHREYYYRNKNSKKSYPQA